MKHHDEMEEFLLLYKTFCMEHQFDKYDVVSFLGSAFLVSAQLEECPLVAFLKMCDRLKECYGKVKKDGE